LSGSSLIIDPVNLRPSSNVTTWVLIFFTFILPSGSRTRSVAVASLPPCRLRQVRRGAEGDAGFSSSLPPSAPSGLRYGLTKGATGLGFGGHGLPLPPSVPSPSASTGAAEATRPASTNQKTSLLRAIANLPSGLRRTNRRSCATRGRWPPRTSLPLLGNVCASSAFYRRSGDGTHRGSVKCTA
jgi:hypothetical protein